MPLCQSLGLWIDDTARGGPLHMAIDEALLELSSSPVLRIYRWDGPWVSIGCFTSMANATAAYPDRPIVRRWTGGGVVDHADDWTYSLIVPSGEPLAALGTAATYEAIHQALADALTSCGHPARLTHAPDPAPGQSARCFDSPVRADVLSNGRKIAGAAQRRTRRGLLHQGSVQGATIPPGLDWALANRLHLSPTLIAPAPTDPVFVRALELTGTRYASSPWKHRR